MSVALLLPGRIVDRSRDCAEFPAGALEPGCYVPLPDRLSGYGEFRGE